jgi:hypothetical protein
MRAALYTSAHNSTRLTAGMAPMTFSNSTLSVLGVVSVVLSGLAVLLLVGRSMRERRERMSSPLRADERLEVLVEAHGRSLARLEKAMRQLANGEKRLAERMQLVVQHVGVVRFDAFEDMGGRLSFSAALLDDRGDGVVITSINGRQDTRCYAKQVRGGTSIHNLSEEEEQAIREALSGARQTVEAR